MEQEQGLNAPRDTTAGRAGLRVLDVEETCARLGNICRATAYNLAARKKLVKVKIGSRTGFLESSVDALIRAGMAE